MRKLGTIQPDYYSPSQCRLMLTTQVSDRPLPTSAFPYRARLGSCASGGMPASSLNFALIFTTSVCHKFYKGPVSHYFVLYTPLLYFLCLLVLISQLHYLLPLVATHNPIHSHVLFSNRGHASRRLHMEEAYLRRGDCCQSHRFSYLRGILPR